MKKFKDERITREYNKVAHKMYWLIMVLLLILMLVKINSGMELKTYALELLCFAVSTLYILIGFTVKGLFFVKKPDEYSIEIQDRIYANSFMINFCIILLGAFILMMLERTYAFMLWTYLAVLFIPGLIVTVFTIRNGLMTWGSGKNKKKTSLNFTLGVICGSLFVGIVTGANSLYHDGAFHASGIVGVLVASTFWGSCFYFLMSFFVQKSENMADARVAKASVEEDIKDEEQEN